MAGMKAVDMGQDRANSGSLRFETLPAQKRIEPYDLPARQTQPVDLGLEQPRVAAFEAVGDQEHDRTLTENAARPVDIEATQRLTDAGPAFPVLRVPSRGGQGEIGILLGQRAGDIGEPGAEGEDGNLAPAALGRP